MLTSCRETLPSLLQSIQLYATQHCDPPPPPPFLHSPSLCLSLCVYVLRVCACVILSVAQQENNPGSSRDLSIDPKELADAISPRTKMILINTPHNPTGKVSYIMSANSTTELGLSCCNFVMMSLIEHVDLSLLTRTCMYRPKVQGWQVLHYIMFTSMAHSCHPTYVLRLPI